MVVVAADELFGPDGTQALQVDLPLGDPLGGLVTGSAFAAGGNSAQEQAEVAATRVEVPAAPAAPDQAPLRNAVDKAMMTGPPTNPLRLPPLGTQPFAAQSFAATPLVAAPFAAQQSFATQPFATQPFNPQPVATRSFSTPQAPVPVSSTPAPAPAARRESPRLPSADQEERILRAARASLAGRQSLRRSHPVVSGLLRVIVPVVFVLLLLILALRGSGSGGNLSDLFG